MSRKITCTSETLEQLFASAQQDFVKQLETVRSEFMSRKYKSEDIEVKVNTKFSLGKDDECCEVIFSPKAWIKMNELVKKFTTEVQWHGTVSRLENNKFLVEDILVFPHEVSAATVVSNQTEYEAWLDKLTDEQFNKLRLHGHSHVRMGVTPSGTDNDVQNKFLSQLAKPADDYDPFYIFIIINKDGDIHCQVYDVTNNALFDNNETFVEMYLDEYESVDIFIKEAKKIATEPVRTYQAGFGHNYNQSYNQGSQVWSYNEDNRNGKHKKKKEKETPTLPAKSPNIDMEDYEEYEKMYGWGVGTMNLVKSQDYFNPLDVKQRCHIIGCGSVGSTIAELLTRLGIKRFHFTISTQYLHTTLRIKCFSTKTLSVQR
jgi:hypothetical protein